jgi:hypothetical protein
VDVGRNAGTEARIDQEIAPGWVTRIAVAAKERLSRNEPPLNAKLALVS